MTGSGWANRPSITAVFVGAVLVASCVHWSRASSADSLAAARASLVAADREAQGRAGRGAFVSALSTLFDATGVYLAPGSLPRGPAAVRAWLERDTLNARSSATWTVLHHDVSADGRDGFTYGYFDVIRPAGDTLPGRYHAYWRRDAGGAWRILVFQRGRREAGPLTVVFPFPARTLAWGPTASGDSLRTQDELRRMEAAFNDSAGSSLSGAFKHFAAPDAGKFAPPSRFVFGPGGIETIFTGAPPGAGPAWRPEAVSVASSNDLGFTYGPAWPRQGPAPRDDDVRGRYFTIWRRQPDGTWKYVVD